MRVLLAIALVLTVSCSYGQLSKQDSLNLNYAKQIYGDDFVDSLSDESLTALLNDLGALKEQTKEFDEKSQEISQWFDREFEPYEGKTYFRPPPGLIAIREERDDRIEDLLDSNGMFRPMAEFTEKVENIDKKTLKKLLKDSKQVKNRGKIGQLLKLPQDTVEVDYKETRDGTTSNNGVHPNLNNGLRKALIEANFELRKKGIPPIKSITISATTNGKHSTKSYHYHGQALDINEINGKKIRMSKWSESLHLSELDEDFLISEATRKLHGDDDDIRYLSRRSFALQKAMAKQSFLREMMGPNLNKQFKRDGKGGRIWKEDYAANQSADTHHNHIHYAVDANRITDQ